MSTSMKAYLRSHLRRNLKTLLYLIVLSVAITFIIVSDNQCVKFRNNDGFEVADEYRYYSLLYVPAELAVVLCLMLPVLEFSFFKKRRNLDCAYALPITRREMGVVHYLSGLLLMVIPYSCAYLLNFLLLLRYPGVFDLLPIAGHYFLCLALLLCFYSMYVFVFNEANSTGDGIWFIALWTFALFLLLVAVVMTVSEIQDFFWKETNVNPSDAYYIETALAFPMGALGTVSKEFQYAVERSEYADLPELWSDYGSMIVLWFGLGIASTIGFFCTFGKRKAEKTEEISYSWFGYRVMIPLYAVCGMILFPSMEMWIIIEVIAFIGYVIYRKGFHLKKSDWTILALLTLLSLDFKLL